MKLGMTGNRSGLSNEIKKMAKDFLEKNSVSEVHHGDCLGSDTDFHNLCESINIKIIIHPPINKKMRAFCKSDFILPEKDYIKRNHDIVDDTEMLIAFPSTNKEILRSGTWSTIRYAKKKKRKILIIYPNCEIEEFS